MSLVAESAKAVEADERSGDEQRPENKSESENRPSVSFTAGSSYDPDNDQCDADYGADHYARRHLDPQQASRGSFDSSHGHSVRVLWSRQLHSSGPRPGSRSSIGRSHAGWAAFVEPPASDAFRGGRISTTRDS